MRTVSQLLEAVQNLDMQFIIEDTLINATPQYVKLQKDQLAEGLKSDGEKIFNIKTGSDQYSPSYAKYKGKSSPIDLHDKGDYYEGIFVDVRTDEMVIASADPKSQKLEENYSPQILGLDDENLQDWADGEVHQDFINAIRETVNL